MVAVSNGSVGRAPMARTCHAVASTTWHYCAVLPIDMYAYIR